MTQRRVYMDLADQILAMINSAEFPPGTRLPPERELAVRLGVSRPMLREAIIALEVMGRVEVKVGSGVVVCKPRRGGSEWMRRVGPFELTQARAALESEAAAVAAPIITDAELEQLEETLRRMVAADGRDEAAAQAADREFHLGIARATQNEVMVGMIEQMWEIRVQSPECQRVYGLVCGEHTGQRQSEHQGIFDALRARDPDRARATMRGHFSRLLETLLTAVENEAIREVRVRLSESRARFLTSVPSASEEMALGAE